MPIRPSPEYPGVAQGMGGCQRTEEVTGHGVVLAVREGGRDSGELRDVPKEAFGSQSDAESWLGESWRALLESGVDQVTLLEESRIEYGPMSLHPED